MDWILTKIFNSENISPQILTTPMDPPPAVDEEYGHETREASPAHWLTRIKPFSMILRHGVLVFRSMEFESGGYKWLVTINFDDNEHVSVNLSMVERRSLRAGWEVDAIFNFLLYNHISEKYLCFRGKARRFSALMYECGFSKLITMKKFINASNGYIFNNTCVFGAEVFVITKKPLLQKMSVCKLSAPFKREWEISNFSHLESVWMSEVFSAGGYKWNVMIFPNGRSKTLGRYVGVCLKCVDAKRFSDHKRVNVEYVFCLRNRYDDEEHRSMTATKGFTYSAPTSGFDDFIAIDDMRDPSRGFVVDDCCILDIELSVLAVHNAV